MASIYIHSLFYIGKNRIVSDSNVTFLILYNCESLNFLLASALTEMQNTVLSRPPHTRDSTSHYGKGWIKQPRIMRPLPPLHLAGKELSGPLLFPEGGGDEASKMS